MKIFAERTVVMIEPGIKDRQETTMTSANVASPRLKASSSNEIVLTVFNAFLATFTSWVGGLGIVFMTDGRVIRSW